MPGKSVEAGEHGATNATTIQADALRHLTRAIFEAAGSEAAEADCIARYLVESNLVGHDSHGVVRIPWYFELMREGSLVPNREPKAILDGDTMAILDGQLGFGQVMAKRATQMAIDKASQHGMAIVGLRNSGHVGRVGEWAVMAADAGMITISFVSTSGYALLVAPHGGIDRRLNANPIAIGIPIEGGPTILADFSTCTIAHGKITVAGNKGTTVPDGCIIDSEGRPTNDPDLFHADPGGAILTLGAHKGYALSIVIELLANALTGGGCAQPEVGRFEQSMLMIAFDPSKLRDGDAFGADARQLTEFVKTSRTVGPDGEVLMPGEPEQRSRSRRLRDGIPIDATTWAQILETSRALKMSPESVDAIIGG